jgi:putative SOS response-associated peptidase YedK
MCIIALFRVMNRYVGNPPPMPGVFPNYSAPVLRKAGAEREPTMMRWGLPPPPRAGGCPCSPTRVNVRSITAEVEGEMREERLQEEEQENPAVDSNSNAIRIMISV